MKLPRSSRTSPALEEEEDEREEEHASGCMAAG